MSGLPRRQFRDAMRAMVPPWLSDRGPRALNTGFKLVWTVGMALDGVVDWMVQGTQARMPGLGTPTALDMSGRDRGVLRGVVEGDEAYALRQQRWLQARRLQGHPLELLRQVRGYLNEDVKCRTVDHSGNWHTIDVGGAESWIQIPGSWDWDGNPVPWARGWVILYAPAHWIQWEHFWTGGETPWGGFLAGDNYTLGQTAPYDVAEDVREIVRTWKPQHMRVVNIIVAFDPASFDPGNPATWPDGTWGNYTTGNPAVEARPSTARYWEGVV